MLAFIRGRATKCFLAVTAACLLQTAASAGTINIILSNMDVSYLGSSNGGVLYDSMGGVPGGGQDPALADGISTAVYEVDGLAVGTQVGGSPDDIFGDLRIINVGATLTKGILNDDVGANGGGFGFDLFTDSGLQLQLGMTNVDLLVTNNVFFFTGEATIISQNLPFGLQFDTSQPVVFSYTATLPAVQAGSTTNAIIASGAFTISGIEIPEPGAIALLFTAMVAVGVVIGHRSQRPELAVATAPRR